MKQILVIFILSCLTVSAYSQTGPEQEIRSMLAKQVAEWNKGNISGYMVGYWDNDSLLFIGKNGPTYGYQPTLERYKKSYPDKATMGKLTSTILSMVKLSSEYYSVIGKWALQRAGGDIGGSYTLLIKKIDGKWMIVYDHSS